MPKSKIKNPVLLMGVDAEGNHEIIFQGPRSEVYARLKRGHELHDEYQAVYELHTINKLKRVTYGSSSAAEYRAQVAEQAELSKKRKALAEKQASEKAALDAENAAEAKELAEKQAAEKAALLAPAEEALAEEDAPSLPLEKAPAKPKAAKK